MGKHVCLKCVSRVPDCESTPALVSQLALDLPPAGLALPHGCPLSSPTGHVYVCVYILYVCVREFLCVDVCVCGCVCVYGLNHPRGPVLG